MKSLYKLFMTIAVGLSLTACSGSGISGDEVVDNFIEYQNNLGSNISFSMKMEGSIQGEEMFMDIKADIYDDKNAHVNMKMVASGQEFDLEIYTIVENGTVTGYVNQPMVGWIKTTQALNIELQSMAGEFLGNQKEQLTYVGEVEYQEQKLHLIEATISSEEIEKQTKLVAPEGLGDIDLGEPKLNYYVQEDGTLKYIEMQISFNDEKLVYQISYDSVGDVEEIIVPQEVIDNAIEVNY